MMTRLFKIALITSVAFIVGCDDKANLGSSSRSPQSNYNPKDNNLIPRSFATDAALEHFRNTTPTLAQHLENLGDPKPVIGPGGRAWRVLMFDKRRGNPSYMQPNHIDDASHSLIILGTKDTPVVISSKKQMDSYKDISE